MGKFAKIQNILNGIFMISISFFMMMDPPAGYTLTLSIFTIMLFVQGIKLLWLYFTAAIHMVDGKSILFRGVLMLDFALFFDSLQDVPARYVIIFLTVITLFMALVEFLRAREARKLGASSWRLYLGEAIVCAVVAIGCQFVHDTSWAAVTVFSIGLILSGFMRITEAFKRTEIIYIQ